jgi:hypothetical protein
VRGPTEGRTAKLCATLSFHLVEEHPLIAMHQRRQSTFDTLVADREETNSRPVDNAGGLHGERVGRDGRVRLGGQLGEHVEPVPGTGERRRGLPAFALVQVDHEKAGRAGGDADVFLTLRPVVWVK